MTFLKQLALPLLLLLHVGFTPNALAKKLEKQQWNELTSANFSIYSSIGDEKAKELLHNLELLRAAIPAVTNVRTTESNIPTRIIAFRHASDLRKFGLNRNTAGIFSDGLRENLILLGNSSFLDSNSIILHEYVHYITENNGSQTYPRWFSEGIAEYFSSARLNDNKFEIGRFPTDRLINFRNCEWVKVSRILANNQNKRMKSNFGCMFYPQSWAIVHYIRTLPDQSTKIAAYLRNVEEGDEHVAAFSDAFDVDIAVFNRDVKKYVKNGQFAYFSIGAGDLVTDFTVSTRAVSREEISLALGKAALRMREYKKARRWYEIATGSEKTQAQAESGIGDTYKFLGDHDSAVSHFTQAVELEPDNVDILIDMGQYWLSVARKADDTESRDKHLKTARAYFGKAWKLNERLPEVYAMYGRSFLLQEDYQQSLDSLEAAFHLLPSNESIRLDLAKAYSGLGRHEDALEHILVLKAWSHGGDSLEKLADELMARINQTANPEIEESD